MNSRPIILLGGTGDIGQRLARRLRQAHDAPILLCSRNPLGASGWARQLSAKLVSIDTTAAKNVEQLPSPSLVINLTETTSPEFVAACLERGMVFFDTSASEAYFKAMVAAGNATNQGTIVPQVGLMPGLTNLPCRCSMFRKSQYTGDPCFFGAWTWAALWPGCHQLDFAKHRKWCKLQKRACELSWTSWRCNSNFIPFLR